MIENITPIQAWELMQNNSQSVLIDVRTAMEHSFIGHPPAAILVAWKELPAMQLNTRFVEQVKIHAPNPDVPVLLLCRSGQRSLEAASVLEQAGYSHLFNILEGFEGPLDADKHRGTLGGWRYHGLPWVQS